MLERRGANSGMFGDAAMQSQLQQQILTLKQQQQLQQQMLLQQFQVQQQQLAEEHEKQLQDYHKVIHRNVSEAPMVYYCTGEPS